MSDPWADVREAWELMNRRDNYYTTFASFAEMPGQGVEGLLSDADALLAVVKAAQKWEESDVDSYMADERAISDALAALPEHLR